MEDQNLNSNDDNSFYYIFHSPLEKVYNVFKNPSLHFYLFFPKLSLNNIKSNTPLDEVGSEYTLESTSKDKYVFVVENVIDLPYHKSFTHRSISHPPSCPDFSNNFSFYWNSTDKNTIFKFYCEQKEFNGENNLLKEVLKNKISLCKSVENYLNDTLKNLEENESISINKSINDVWNFIIDLNNQKYLCANKNVAVNKIEENKIEINDIEEKNKLIFSTSKNCENDDKKQYNLDLISSVNSLPKQKIEIILIKMGEKQTFLIFKHIILEFIPYDVLMSYSAIKKKSLKKIKNILEEGDDSSIDTKDNSEDGLRFFKNCFNNNITLDYKNNWK